MTRRRCPYCDAILRFYNIGFDDGYVCDACGRMYETYEVNHRHPLCIPKSLRAMIAERLRVMNEDAKAKRQEVISGTGL